MIGWVFFRADNIYLAMSYIKGLFTFGRSGWTILSYLSMKLILCTAAGIIFCGPIQLKMKSWYEECRKVSWVQKADTAIQFSLLILSVMSLIAGTYNPFIYFQF